MKKEIEILAPAGSYESLKAAIAAGADAVYIGGSRFGARAYANNLTEDDLLEAIDYVHLHGKKIYLTVNTLLKERELNQELYDYLLPYYKQGLDAVIVQDIGVLHFIRKHFPDLSIHASTQMTITNVSGAKFLEAQGVERVVTARELSLEEIKEISEQTNVEIESFVHGALCYCYSGQCLYSSLLGGRSGNRGQCAQPCRLPYKVNGETSYVMSLKDLCTVEIIPDLAEAGIFSFKIEGRMKKPEYVAAVVSIYRKYVDIYLQKGRKGYQVSKQDKDILMDLYNRGGFHSGYYKVRNGKEMLSLKRPNHAGVKAVKAIRQQGKELKLQALVSLNKGDIIELPTLENYTLGQNVNKNETFSIVTKNKIQITSGMILNRTRNEKLLQKIKTEFVEKKVKEKIKGNLILSTKESAKLSLTFGDNDVCVDGEIAQEAINQPMDKARIEKQMRKTGNTAFEFETLDIRLDGDLFMPMQSLNELRRQGLEKLEQTIYAKYRRQVPERLCENKERHINKNTSLTGFYVYVETKEQFFAVLKFKTVKRIYVDCNIVKQAWKNQELTILVKAAKEQSKEIYFAMPYIFRKETKNLYKEFFDDFAFDGVLIRNYESYQYLSENAPDVKVVLDHNMYQFNSEMKNFWNDKHISGFTAPLELNFRELQDVGCENSELIVYGYLQMMVSAQCIRKTTSGCTHKIGYMKMTDRYNKEFTIKSCCDYCYNVIYNTEAMCLIDQKKEIEMVAPKEMRLHFTIEDTSRTIKIMNGFEDVFIRNKELNELGIEFTRGHFKRGIK